jgi:hypothetical protein
VKRPPQKHIGFFDVLEAFQQAKGCALCELEARGIRRYLESLLYENVNDVGVRADLAKSRGYCRLHAHMLLEFQDGLGTAILYRDQAMMFLDFLKSLNGLPAKLLRRKMPEEWGIAALCPACRIAAGSRECHLSTLVEHLGDPDLRKAIEASPGLCVPHLLPALRQAQDASSREYLASLHVDKFQQLADDLAEFDRKHDYRFSREPWGKERDSWIRAINMMAGRKDVV